MPDKELWQEIIEQYPKISTQIAKVIMPNVYRRFAELKFPLDGDDEAYADWFMNVYTPLVESEEADSLENYLF